MHAGVESYENSNYSGLPPNSIVNEIQWDFSFITTCKNVSLPLSGDSPTGQIYPYLLYSLQIRKLKHGQDRGTWCAQDSTKRPDELTEASGLVRVS